MHAGGYRWWDTVISSRDEGMSDSEGVNRTNPNEGQKMKAALCSRPDLALLGNFRMAPFHQMDAPALQGFGHFVDGLPGHQRTRAAARLIVHRNSSVLLIGVGWCSGTKARWIGYACFLERILLLIPPTEGETHGFIFSDTHEFLSGRIWANAIRHIVA